VRAPNRPDALCAVSEIGDIVDDHRQSGTQRFSIQDAGSAVLACGLHLNGADVERPRKKSARKADKPARRGGERSAAGRLSTLRAPA
jgi:hypothetical protein